MRKKTESTQGGTHSIRLLKAMTEQGRSVFTTSEARQMAEPAGIPRGYVTNLLMLMIRNGWITRLKRGFYARSSPALGESQVHSFTIATHLVTPSAISHWSALSHHGLTEQIPRVITAFTPKKVECQEVLDHLRILLKKLLSEKPNRLIQYNGSPALGKKRL